MPKRKKVTRKRTMSAKGRRPKFTKRKFFKRSSSVKGRTSRSFPMRRTLQAGSARSRNIRNAVLMNKSKPDESTTWLQAEIYYVATDIVTTSVEYVDWSLNNPIDYLGSSGAVAIPGWSQYALQYRFYRPIGSSTTVKIWQVKGSTVTADTFIGAEVALIPMDSQSSPVTGGTTYTGGIIDTGSASFWRNQWPHTTGRILDGSVYNTNGAAFLKGKFTTWAALSGQKAGIEDVDPNFWKTNTTGQDAAKLCSWNLAISAINPDALDNFSFQGVIFVRHKVKWSIKANAATALDIPDSQYLDAMRAIRQREAYRVLIHVDGKYPKGHPARRQVKPQYIGVCDTIGDRKDLKDTKGDQKDDDLDEDMEKLELTPSSKAVEKKTQVVQRMAAPGSGPGSIQVKSVSVKLKT